MNEYLTPELLKASFPDVIAAFHEALHTSVRIGFWTLLEEEVASLCGPKYDPDPQSPYQRDGTDGGTVYFNSKLQHLRKPCVVTRDGSAVTLETYRHASSSGEHYDQALALVEEGVSQLSFGRASGLMQNSFSQVWAQKSLEELSNPRERTFYPKMWMSLILDGAYYRKDLYVIVALAVHPEGIDRVLDFEFGSPESEEPVIRVISRLLSQGTTPDELRKMLLVQEGKTVIQGAVSKLLPAT